MDDDGGGVMNRAWNTLAARAALSALSLLSAPAARAAVSAPCSHSLLSLLSLLSFTARTHCSHSLLSFTARPLSLPSLLALLPPTGYSFLVVRRHRESCSTKQSSAPTIAGSAIIAIHTTAARIRPPSPRLYLADSAPKHSKAR